MWLNNSQRARLLLRHLLLQPQYLPSYLAHLPRWGRSPLDLGLPLWPYAAISRCARLLRPDSRVFEFGTGGSTVFLARRAATVESVEDSAAWHQAVTTRLAQLGLAHATVLQRDLPASDPTHPHWPAYLAPLHGQYDLIVIDGQDNTDLRFGESGHLRTHCFFHSENFIRPGGVIVVDDSWRYPALRSASKARRVETLASVGPCRYGVTTADFYYY